MRYFSRDFPCDFSGIAGSYRLRRISSKRSSCNFERTFNGLILINRTEAASRSHDFSSVQSSRSYSKLSFFYKIAEATEPVKFYDNRKAVATTARRPYDNGRAVNGLRRHIVGQM